jgi:tetratricopeptide (TPR) repeat protein
MRQAPDYDLQSILGLTQGDVEAMLARGVQLYSNGELAEAEVLLSGLMAIAPRDARPVKLLASVMLLKTRHREAETLYTKALELDPNDPYTLVSLGEIKLKSLEIPEAMPLFERLFAMDPNAKHPAANRGRQLVQTYYKKLVQA